MAKEAAAVCSGSYRQQVMPHAVAGTCAACNGAGSGRYNTHAHVQHAHDLVDHQSMLPYLQLRHDL
jgi:hypothetical protein